MNYLRSFLLFLTATFIISSCQKELSFEEGTARGSLKKASGDCMPATIVGSFKKDTLLTAGNYVDIQVDITQTGTYVIKTDTLNGYSFIATGVVAVEGLNTIRLQASGRPVAAALDVFTIKFDTTSCQLNVVVTGTGGGGGGGTAAVYTLVGSPTACTGATQTTNFYVGIPTNSSNYVDIKVNVTTAGTYTISTPVVNGVSFSAAGALSVGTNQNIRLLANGGTPTAAGSTFSYPLTTAAPASNCGFNLTVQAAPTPATYTFECPSNPTFFGTYQQGVSTAGDSIKINVTSVAGGSYTITTNTTASSNGVTYGGSGVLPASPNPQSVTLFVLGTPSASGTFTYTLTGTGVTSTCTFTQTYSAAPTTANGTITFKIGTVTKTFNFSNGADTMFTSFPPPAPPGNYYVLSVFGDAAAAPSQEAFSFDLVKSAPYFSNGSTYTVNQFLQTIILDVAYTDSTGDDYTATTDGTTQTPPFSVKITSITPIRVIGTFTGPLKNATGTTITALQGTFDLPLQ